MNHSEAPITKNRACGRIRKNDEDKALPFPLRLSREYQDKIELIPGKKNSDKVKLLIDTFICLKSREEHQLREIKKYINRAYLLSQSVTRNPEVFNDPVKLKKAKKTFLDSVSTLQDLIILLNFDMESILKYLRSSDIEFKLHAIFYLKSSLPSSPA